MCVVVWLEVGDVELCQFPSSSVWLVDVVVRKQERERERKSEIHHTLSGSSNDQRNLLSRWGPTTTEVILIIESVTVMMGEDGEQ